EAWSIGLCFGSTVTLVESDIRDVGKMPIRSKHLAMEQDVDARVIAVARDGEHRFSKQVVPEIRILAGLGVEGEAHMVVKVQHRSGVEVNQTQPNLRQVHLIHAEFFDELGLKGFSVSPADLGENITTAGIDLLGLPKGTLLRVGADAV